MHTINKALATLSGIAVVAGAAIITVGAGHDEPTVPTAPLTGNSSSGNISVAQASTTPTVSADLARSFSGLRRSVSASDQLPANAGIAHGGSSQGGYDIQTGVARVIGRPGGSPVWLAPGATGACLVVANGGGDCGPSAGKEGVAHRGLFVALLPVNGEPATVQGILPDGATVTAVDKDGNTVSPDVSGQAYSLPGGTAKFTLHFSDGTSDTEAMPVAPAPALPSTPAPKTP